MTKELVEEVARALCQNALGHKRCPCAESGVFNCADTYPGQQATALLPILARQRNAGIEAAAGAAFNRLHPHPNQPQSDWTNYAKTRADAAWDAATAIRALKEPE